MGEFARLETELAETLAEEDVLKFGATMEPGSLGAVLDLREPVGRGVRVGRPPCRRPAGTQGRIPIQAIIAAVEADEAALVAEGV